MSLHSTLLFFAYITNSKTGVGFREIFQSEKWFHGLKSLKSIALGYLVWGMEFVPVEYY
jgi:hypothetical protein